MSNKTIFQWEIQKNCGKIGINRPILSKFSEICKNSENVSEKLSGIFFF